MRVPCQARRTRGDHGEDPPISYRSCRAREPALKGRILFLCPGLTEPGGTAKRSRLIADGLAARGWCVRVITRSGILCLPRFSREPNLTVIELPGLGKRRVGGLLFYVVATPLALVLGIGARCVLSLQLLSTSTVGGLCAAILRRPLIAMSTTTGELSETGYISATRTAGLRRALIGRARWLLAQTPEGAEQLLELGPVDRIDVLHNPVDVPVSPPGLNGEPRVLYTGRLSREKDLTSLLDAWLAVLPVIPNARLTLVGAGGAFRSVESEIRERVEADPRLRSSVDMPGWVEDVSTFLASSDVFVLPSLEEGMSNALLEACAHGRLVVASRIPPNVAVLGSEHKYLFRPGDPEDLADVLLKVLRDDPQTRGEIRRRTLSRIERQFSVGSVIDRLERLIDAPYSARH